MSECPKCGFSIDDPRLPQRFWGKVVPEPNTGCWLWLGHCINRGYGFSSHTTMTTRLAHKIAYELLIGPVPEGLQLDHLCRQRSCVNPEHLEPVTAAENSRRGLAGAHFAEKTHCPQGHPYAGSNLGIGPGLRYCKACKRAQSAKFRSKHASLR